MGKIEKYKKKDGTTAYMFQAYLGVDSDGKKRRTTRRGFKTSKEAQLAYNRLMIDISENGIPNASREVITFKDLFELWFETYQKGVKPSTQQRTYSLFKCNILPDIGDIPLKKFTPTLCQRYINKWIEEYALFRHIKCYVSNVFKYGVLSKYLSDNPIDRIIVPRIQKEDKKDVEFYSKEELQYFFECLKELKDDRAFAFFRILAFTGARKGEVLALTWDDINLDDGTITFNKTLACVHKKLTIQSPKTKSSVRTISLDIGTIEIIKRWRKIQNERKMSSGERASERYKVVFCNTYNTKKHYLYPYYPKQVIDRVSRKCPDVKRIKTHGFRHTHASLLFESGIDAKIVQQRLGHSSIKTTLDIYTHVTPKLEKDIGSQFAKYVNL